MKIEDEGLSGGHSPVITMLDDCHTFLMEPYIATGPFKWVENSLHLEGEAVNCIAGFHSF